MGTMPPTDEIPIDVAANLAFLEGRHLWHSATRNSPAKSCVDAANKRNRLGNSGIPLFDELKSHVGVYELDGHRRYVVAHCRGHQRRDDAKFAAVVGSLVEKVTQDELADIFGLDYGLINPFFFARREDVLQVFDKSVIEKFFSPYTMMTNLGHLEYGVEFDPRQLIDALPHCLVADIVTEPSRRPALDHTLGILTGNGPESGITLWDRINDRIEKNPQVPLRGDTSFPRVLVESLPQMGLSMELQVRAPEVKETVLEGVARLCASGATVVGIACNTTQYFSPDIRQVCSDHGATFVSLVDETASFLEREGISEFDLIGIRAVSDLEKWSDFRRIKEKFHIHVPTEAEGERIDKLAYIIKKKPDAGRAVSELGHLIRQATVTDTVLIALTELSIVTAKQPNLEKRSEKRFVDTLNILADRMAEIYLVERLALERITRPSEEWDAEERTAENVLDALSELRGQA